MKIATICIFLGFSFCIGCHSIEKKEIIENKPTTPFLMVLGIAQDAGYPQAGCQKDCCKNLWGETAVKEQVVALGIADSSTGEKWLFEATPDFKNQTMQLQSKVGGNVLPNGIFVTHGHIGHYTGLMQLGREAIGAKQQPVFVMPRMQKYLTNNGPWSQLVKLENIDLRMIESDSVIQLNSNFKVTPFLVPHRDEFTETVGFKIEGPNYSALFIPDIDKWNKWERDIKVEIRNVDYAFLDATFFKNGEIKGRDMSQIPHPFVEESMNLMSNLSEEERKKVFFIHFNHTNPILKKDSAAYQEVIEKGFSIAEQNMILPM